MRPADRQIRRFEEIDHWVNCHNVAATISDWYDRIADFKAVRWAHEAGRNARLF